MIIPLFNIEVFNQKTTQEKIDYLFNCLLDMPTKGFTESPTQYSNRIKELKHKTDLGKPEAADMLYMLKLIKKYKTGEDHLIIRDYEEHVYPRI